MLVRKFIFQFFVTAMLLMGATGLRAAQGNSYTIGIKSPGDTIYGGETVVFEAVILDDMQDTISADSIEQYLTLSWEAEPDRLLEQDPYLKGDPQFSFEPIDTYGVAIVVRLTVSAEDLDGFGEEMTDSVTVHVLPERPAEVAIELADVMVDSTYSPYYNAFHLMGTADTLALRAVLRNKHSEFFGNADSAVWQADDLTELHPADQPWKRYLTAQSDSGFVIVTYRQGTLLLTDTVRVEVHQPRRPELFFVTDTGESRTAPQDLEAGRPVDMLVRLGIQDDPLLASSDFKFPAVVRDLAKVPENLKLDDWPYVIAENRVGRGRTPLGQYFELEFSDGVAEFELTVLRVPTLSDSTDLHQISIEIGRNELKDTTEAFSISPGPPQGMRIYLGESILPDDSLRIKLSDDTRDSTLTFTAKTDSVDKYGNRIEPLRPAHWTLDPEIGIFEGSDSSVTFGLIIDHRSDAGGILKAEVDVGRTTVSDALEIRITGWGAHLLSARTKDRDGDGLLDGMLMEFERPIRFSPDSLYTKTRIYYPGDGDRVDYIISGHEMVSGNNTSVELFFDEFTGSFQLDHQTDWRPLIGIRGLEDIADVSGVRSDDNVGPIIWYVAVDSLSDSQLVRIAFTERIDWFGTADSTDASPTGVDTLRVAPSILFQLGVSGGNDAFVPTGDILESVESMLGGPNFVEFSLDTGTRIDSSYALRILVAADSILQDVYGNSAVSHDWVRIVALSDAPESGGGTGESESGDTSDSTTTEEYPEGACGDCGTGVWHAFIPLVWLRVAGAFRKRKRKK